MTHDRSSLFQLKLDRLPARVILERAPSRSFASLEDDTMGRREESRAEPQCKLLAALFNRRAVPWCRRDEHYNTIVHGTSRAPSPTV